MASGSIPGGQHNSTEGDCPAHAQCYIGLEHFARVSIKTGLLKPTTFGQFLKEKRLALDLSLREFARQVGMQPSNYCNVEADVLPPPPAKTLEKLARALGLKKGTSDYETLHDLAAEGRDEIPADI